jgi:hypothetical protein
LIALGVRPKLHSKAEFLQSRPIHGRSHSLSNEHH